MPIQTTPSTSQTCILIGQDRLLIECATILQSNPFAIKAIFSPSDQIKSWAESQAIACYSSIFDVDWNLLSADYLFSIVNNDIIPARILDKIGQMAINYHDAPLPRYAGSNATAWAILNGEPNHGVTWHAINAGIDTGDILKQRNFQIEPTETTFSLNLKCVEQAALAFAELVDELLNNTAHRVPQNLAQRSFYNRSKKPGNGGWINWQCRAEEIDRLFRSTQYGQYRNPFSVTKMMVADEVYAVGALTVLPEFSDKPPGTLLEVTGCYWKIATPDHVIKLSTLTTLRGEEVQLDALKNQHRLAINDCLPIARAAEIDLLREMSESSYVNESYWVARLRDFQPTIPVSRQADIDLTRIPQSIYDSVLKFSDDQTEAQFVILAAWLIYLRRTESNTRISIQLKGIDANVPDCLSAFFAQSLPFSVTVHDQQNFMQAVDQIRQAYDQIVRHGSYLIDCWLRYPELAEQPREAGYQVTTGTITPIPGASEYALPNSFLTLLSELLAHTQLPIAQVDWITQSERQKLLVEWNTSDAPYPDYKTIHRQFEEQVNRTPDQIALIAPGARLTYQELNHRSNQLAHYLLEQHAIQPDQLIAVCLDRSASMLIAILGILKSGAGYVPLDPSYPDNRIRFIVNETQARAIITTQDMATRLSNLNSVEAERKALISLNDVEFCNALKNQPTDNPIVEVRSQHLAYVMYTSGSTGTPKGVQIEHRSIVNRIVWMDRAYPLKATDRILQKTPYIFDVSVWELFWANWAGATIVFAKPDGHRNLQYLARLICDEQISIVHFTPTMLNGFVQALQSDPEYTATTKDHFSHLHHLFCSGEALHETTVIRGRTVLPKVRIHNLYGPTEAAIDVLSYECVKDAPIYLGKPISNTRVYVLDDQQRLIPPDIAGELYLAGDGIARGYLNQPELTSKHFIANPFQTEDDKKRKRFDRLYKTGDQVHWSSDGELVYIGRKDRQIKLRGNRIELGEIEEVIQKHPAINQCAVVVHDNQLIAYYVPGQATDESDLQSHAATWLPDYMVPNKWIPLEKIPTGISGKVNFEQLTHSVESKSRDLVPPRNSLEITLAMAFSLVLGIEQDTITITDDFFKLGGDSILAIRLIGRINELVNKQIQVRHVFELKTIQALSEYIEESEPIAKRLDPPYQPFCLIELSNYQDLLKSHDIEDIYPASRLQIGMLLESSLNDFGTYHDVFYYEIKRPFVEETFLRVWKALANKHALLRARFLLSEQNALDVVIFKQAHLHYQFHADQSLPKLIDAERLVHFSHTEECLFHLIVNQHTDNFEFIFSFHHAIVDGWSVASLINEFVQAYAFERSEIPAPVGHPPLTYGEFVRNELHYLEDQESIAFWKDYLDGFNPAQAKWKFDDQATSPDGLFSCAFHLTSEEAKQVHQLARYNAIGVDTVFLYAYLKTLSFFMNSDDITIGVVFNNRLEKVGGDTLFGLFLNVLPFRQKLDRDQSIQNALLATFANRVKLLAHKHIPYAQLKSTFKRDLYQFGYNFINFHVFSQSKSAIGQRGGFERASIPFILEVTQNDSFKIELKSHDSYVNQDYLHYFGLYLRLALQNILMGKNELQLSMQDYQSMVIDWNATGHPYPKEKVLHQLFEEQVERTPNAIALEFEKVTLTYCALNRHANRVAHYLMAECNVKHDELVALCVDRNEWMVIAILAILKSGAAYVPIEPSYPDERIEFILKNTKAKVVLTNVIHQKRVHIPEWQNFVICVDSESNQNRFQGLSTKNPISSVKSRHLAYVIYTSGTTGKPNGVMIEHESAVNLCLSMIGIHKLCSGKKIALYSNYAFDAFVYELFPALASGCHQFLLPNPMRHDLSILNEYYTMNSIQVSFIPSGLVNEFINIYSGSKLELLYTGGDVLNLNSTCNLDQVPFELINEYGPTEATVCTTYHNVTERKHERPNTNIIGRPISNSRCYVVDRNGHFVPFGVTGELYISGAGLSRGYLNNEQLTANKFLSTESLGLAYPAFSNSGRFYKTGDLVRWRLDGTLEFIGRNDRQIKIFGYRIELSEIEAALNKHPDIDQAVVIQRKIKQNCSSFSNYLVAYFVPKSNHYLTTGKHSEGKFKQFLERLLPRYMVPQYFVALDRMPYNCNSKIDRDNLPEPLFLTSDHYVPPMTLVETKLCNIFSEVLGLPANMIGIDDDFFEDLGGSSIQAIKLAILINRELCANLQLKSLVVAKSVRGISNLVEPTRGGDL